VYKCPLKLVVVHQHILLIKIGLRPCMVSYRHIINITHTHTHTHTYIYTHTSVLYNNNNFNHNPHYWHQNKCIFIVNYLSLYVVKKFWCKLHEDGDKPENMSQSSNRKIHRLWNCAFVGATKVLTYQNSRNERRKFQEVNLDVFCLHSSK